MLIRFSKSSQFSRIVVPVRIPDTVRSFSSSSPTLGMDCLSHFGVPTMWLCGDTSFYSSFAFPK